MTAGDYGGLRGTTVDYSGLRWTTVDYKDYNDYIFSPVAALFQTGKEGEEGVGTVPGRSGRRADAASWSYAS